MANTEISLRKWNSTPGDTSYFKLITKLTDFGAPLSLKSILGFYINYNYDKKIPTTTNTVLIEVCYRENTSHNWTTLCNITDYIISSGTRNYTNHFDFIPIKHLKSIQLKLNVISEGGFSINDFGLIYRIYNKVSTETHDED